MFAQQRNRLTTHFSKRIPTVKHSMTVLAECLWDPLAEWRRYREVHVNRISELGTVKEPPSHSTHLGSEWQPAYINWHSLQPWQRRQQLPLRQRQRSLTSKSRISVNNYNWYQSNACTVKCTHNSLYEKTYNNLLTDAYWHFSWDDPTDWLSSLFQNEIHGNNTEKSPSYQFILTHLVNPVKHSDY